MIFCINHVETETGHYFTTRHRIPLWMKSLWNDVNRALFIFPGYVLETATVIEVIYILSGLTHALFHERNVYVLNLLSGIMQKRDLFKKIKKSEISKLEVTSQ